MSFHRLLSLWCSFFWYSHLQAKDRLTKILRGACKCSEGNCFQQFGLDETKNFLDAFEARSKLEQDTILFLAWSDAGQGHGPQLRTSKSTRRDVFFSWGSTWKEYVLKLCLAYLHTELTKLVWLINALGRKIPNLQNWERLLTPFVSSYTILWLSRCPASYMQQTWLLNFCFAVVVSMCSSFFSVLWFR